MSNLIYIKFYSKKSFPPGKWCSEPDYCKWTKHERLCLALRDMSLGTWKGFVALESSHPCYGKSVEDILKAPTMIDAFLSVYGGICSAGYLPLRYEEQGKDYWWLGIESSHGEDLYPLLKTDTNTYSLASVQTYKDLSFIRKETNKLAAYVSRIK